MEAPGKAVDLLSAATALPKSRIKDAMQKGAVWLVRDGRAKRLRRASRELVPGDELRLYYSPTVLDAQPPAPTLLVDERPYSLWYKPAGLMSSGTRYGDHHSIARWVEGHLQRPSFPVHRLDRYTRGLMLIAHAKKTARQLSAQFREHRVSKTYQARVRGRLMSACTLTLPLDGKAAISHVSPTTVYANSTDVSVRIDTGRKHQIRRHLAHIDHPVVGDVIYGGAEVADLQLVAVCLGFVCPVRGARRTVWLPKDRCLFDPGSTPVEAQGNSVQS